METREYTVVNRRRLTSIFNADDIISVIETSTLFGKSLAICLKHGASTELFKGYGDFRINGPVVFIPLAKYTHHIPTYMAIPKEQYNNIVVVTKRATINGEYMGTFTKATITKKVTW